MKKLMTLILVILSFFLFAGCGENLDGEKLFFNITATYDNSSLIESKMIKDCVKNIENVVITKYENIDENALNEVVAVIKNCYNVDKSIIVKFERQSNTIILVCGDVLTKTLKSRVMLPIK